MWILQAAIKHGVTVAEVTYCNSISVSEHVVMMILSSDAQLHPVLSVDNRRGLEHRRLRCTLLRSRRQWRLVRLRPAASVWPF